MVLTILPVYFQQYRHPTLFILILPESSRQARKMSRRTSGSPSSCILAFQFKRSRRDRGLQRD